MIAAGLATAVGIRREREAISSRRVLITKTSAPNPRVLQVSAERGPRYRVLLPPGATSKPEWELVQAKALGQSGSFRIFLTYRTPSGLASYERLFQINDPQISALGPNWARARPPLSLPRR